MIKEFTLEEIRDVTIGMPFKSLPLVRIALFWLHLQRNDFNRTKTAKTFGCSLRCVRRMVIELKDYGIEVPESPYGTNKPNPNKKSKVYKERSFVSYEYKDR